jgi:hypothetical protein
MTMVMFLILACLFFAGWARSPWWTLATFAVAVPLMLLHIGSINFCRSEAGLPTDGPPIGTVSWTKLTFGAVWHPLLKGG